MKNYFKLNFDAYKNNFGKANDNSGESGEEKLVSKLNESLVFS